MNSRHASRLARDRHPWRRPTWPVASRAGNLIMKQPGSGFDDTSAALSPQLDAAERSEANAALAAAPRGDRGRC